ncbi:PREDICTED: uncharacterized protein LOC109158421 [Ipomoea nil]|uniref:uncharacterized protein LOC109158421 n=1 Tax=Ipomoea nil TaxID=35883 RepID=UPI0009013DA5|nr:PREDICTED: uncharacterized protein LOC109158421 [Ipomoea nil]
MALIFKHVEVTPDCSICGLQDESLMHIFYSCPLALEVWRLSTIQLPNANIDEPIDVWFQQIFNSCDKQKLHVFAAVIYSIWQVHNEAVWEGLVRRPIGVWQLAASTWQQWGQALDVTQLDMHVSVGEVGAASMFTCKVDGGIDTTFHKATFGAILTNAVGGFVAALNGDMHCVLDPVMVEAEACKQALIWIRTRGVMEVQVQTDCLNIVQVLQSEKEDRTYLGSIIHECKQTVKDLPRCVFHYIPRSANQAAHALAKAVGSQPGPMSWEDVPPHFISELI